VTETEMLPTPTTTDADRLVQVEAELRQAERAFEHSCLELVAYNRTHVDGRLHMLNNKLFARVGAMFADPQRRELERDRDRTLRNRWELLKERADLMKSLGLIR
jgi:hypothetical protein